MFDMKSVGITWKRLLILSVFCLPFVLLHQNQIVLIRDDKSVSTQDNALVTGDAKSVISQDKKSDDCLRHPKGCHAYGGPVRVKLNITWVSFNALVMGDAKSVISQDKKSDNCLRHPKGCHAYGGPVRVKLNITWTPSNVATRKQEYEERKKQVSQGCQTLDENVFQPKIDHVLEHSLWNNKNNFIWCPVLKAGSSLWMRILAKTSKLRAPKLRQKLRRTYKSPMEKAKKIKDLKNFTKFFIVRHPFERLLSAYRDKMLFELISDNLFRPLQIEIAKKYSWDEASNATSKVNTKVIQYLSKTKTNDTEWIHPTFVQFLLHVQDEMQQLWDAKGDFEMNGHWLPYWHSCAPCLIDYDVIARMETIDIDNDFIIHQSHINPNFNKHEHSTVTDKFKSTNEATKYYFGQVPLWLLKDLFRLYLPDFHIFGYDPQKFYNMAQQ